MYKEDLALNNLQWLICHKTKQNQTKPNLRIMCMYLTFCILKDIWDDEEKERCHKYTAKRNLPIYIDMFIYTHKTKLTFLCFWLYYLLKISLDDHQFLLLFDISQK